ncbi:MAG: phenylalanine--tRNA ligase subunit alpha [Sulfurimonas sp.]|nr:phenylalanine--tRNA ligase subunit alpha [Sulfurimonadaceae bacterium]
MEKWYEAIRGASSTKELESLRVDIFGKKGVLTLELAKIKDLSPEQKGAVAKELNTHKNALMQELVSKKDELSLMELEQKMAQEGIDTSLYSQDARDGGALHPVMQTMDRIVEYFASMNFAIKTGSMVENDFNNFEALNLPKHHPARDMQDTFYFKDEMLLRTHTSPVQIRTMLNSKPPIRMIAPGAVFRRDYDLTHTPMFHQVEGLLVDKSGSVSFANLKFILEDFLKHMFGDVKVRFRPSFFPFTEPSAEADISCVFCHGDGCRVCSKTGWLEVLGCGIVDPNVFKAVGYEDVSGYAFGLGVERFAMLIHQIGDLRSLFEGDMRLLEQFR